MMWDTAEHRLALLELLSSGVLRRRRAQADSFDALSELPWTRATGRRDEIGIVPEERHELLALLHRVWPSWRESLVELTERGLPPTPEGWARLLDARRADRMPLLPPRLNRRTAASLTAHHSKAAMTEDRLGLLEETTATHDGAVRIRPPAGLRARTPAGEVDLAAVAAVLGEVGIPERAFLDGLEFTGGIRAVLLVENLGAWRDLPAPPGWLLAFVPGWDTATVARLFERLPGVPTVHFGDLDPNGVRIYQHLRARRPDLLWFIPAFWAESVDGHALRGSWPTDLDLGAAPPLVRDLARRGLWLEQESIVLDPRLVPELELLLPGRTRPAD